MSFLTDTEVKTLDYAFAGQPSVAIATNASFPSTLTLDYAVNGEPFVTWTGLSGAGAFIPLVGRGPGMSLARNGGGLAGMGAQR